MKVSLERRPNATKENLVTRAPIGLDRGSARPLLNGCMRPAKLTMVSLQLSALPPMFSTIYSLRLLHRQPRKKVAKAARHIRFILGRQPHRAERASGVALGVNAPKAPPTGAYDNFENMLYIISLLSLPLGGTTGFPQYPESYYLHRIVSSK